MNTRLFTQAIKRQSTQFSKPFQFQSSAIRFSSRNMSATTNALVYVEKGKATIQEVAKPKLRDDYILVKVNAVGINPTDWKHIEYGLAEAGSRMGCDYAGVVEEVGSKVTKSFKKGDRISGVAHGGQVLVKDCSLVEILTLN